MRDMKREAEAVLPAPKEKRAPWKKDFTTVSGMEVNPLATPADVAGLDFQRDVVAGTHAGRGTHATEHRAAQ